MATILRLFVVFVVLQFDWNQANASCLPGVPPPTFRVGSDNQCQYSTIQAAITAVPSPTSCAPNIVISAEHPWTEHLTIADRSLTLIGSTSSCGASGTDAVPGVPEATPTAPVLTINGAGNTSTSVITITGNSNVTLKYLEITGGNIGQDSEGGGIFFGGAGSLTLNATTIDNNQAGYGGGIDVSPSGNATLNLQANTLILNNTAGHSGGGIRIEGSTRLFMLDSGSTVSFNTAQFDYGGGIEILGPARADIGSSGAVFVGAVSNNSAAYGGGMAVLAESGGDATLRLFSTSATQPVLVSNNSASAKGGAFYIKPDAQNNVNTGASLCAYNYRINGNSAPDGTAIYADTDVDSVVLYASSVYFNPSGNCGPESPASLGSVACAAGIPCNEVSDNIGVDGSGNPIGAVISTHEYAALAAEGLKMSGNHAARMISADNAYLDSNNYLHACLIADNHSGHELIYSDSGYFGAPLTIANCTLANNTIDNGYTIFAISLMTLTDTIINQPGHFLVDHQVGDCENTPCVVTASYLLSNDISTLPSNSDIVAINPGDPLFVDAANGNYHLPAYRQNGLLSASRAIDFAPTVSGNAAHDIDGNAYDVNVPVVPDLYGTRDLGAYEMQPIADRVFADTFGDRVSLVN